MKAYRYNVLGFPIESALLLPATQVDSTPRLRIGFADGEPPRALDAPPLARRDSGAASHTIRTAEGGYLLTFSTHASLFVDKDLTRMDIRLGPTGTGELVSLLVIGVGLSFVATLDGGLVLHSSAVAAPAGVLAFVGPSGAGKSTTAALLARVGKCVISDDALRIDLLGERYVGTGAGTELRLRPNALAIADALASWRRRTTGDGRVAITSPRSALAARPIAGIYVPRIGGASARKVVARPASAHEGAIQLLRALRVGTWLDAAILERQTRAVAALARSVPVYFLDMPPDLPADVDFARDLASAVGFE